MRERGEEREGDQFSQIDFHWGRVFIYMYM